MDFGRKYLLRESNSFNFVHKWVWFVKLKYSSNSEPAYFSVFTMEFNNVVTLAIQPAKSFFKLISISISSVQNFYVKIETV